MKPEGYIRGFIANKDQTDIQAGEELLPDSELDITSVILKGDGIYRALTPLQNELSYNDLFPGYYLSGTDFTAQGAFFFFGLSAGEYELTIKAKGYEPYSITCNVAPGQYQDVIIIEPLKEKAVPQ